MYSGLAASRLSRINNLVFRCSPKVTYLTNVYLGTRHNESCPASKKCPSKGSTDSVGGIKTRQERSGPVVFGFIPQEWFTFFHVKTGVSGGYVFLFVLTNYCLSKEIFVMEHEYYTGLSIFLIVYFVITRLGDTIGKSLDKQVDDFIEQCYVGRKTEIKQHETAIKNAKNAIVSAESQKILMDAKKENILLQLEANYRERMMQAYRAVSGRMDYHIKVYYTSARIHQKWMIGWILREVRKSITPDFRQRALQQAIQDLEAVASRAK